MTKKIIGSIGIIIIIVLIILGLNTYTANPQPGTSTTTPAVSPVTVTPITHATAILGWDGASIYLDPTGSTTAFAGKSPANIILVTDIHGDHFSTSTLNAVIGSSTLIVPQAVKDLLPPNLAAQAKVLNNNQTITEQGFEITALPMYNIPEATSTYHTKGRGNGYVIEKDGYRVYVAGDTSSTPEMRALRDIDMAFVPMNLPFTMSIEEAADAVLAFKPKEVYPYHYRGQTGLSDIYRFKQLVDAGNENIRVMLLNWYPTP